MTTSEISMLTGTMTSRSFVTDILFAQYGKTSSYSIYI
ncbi:hypothetical protein SLEP1_g6775 [Rubroshorea leprosula]|uniref:Uncharacterized protein n=1 Tax=Rubroshorea leprosula TaxID=152421 RepID=A0AAV5I4J8_9ROSI|nr:hypothetical protein SLEP1_g6775 [Rubroshorea leprosula]